MKEENVELLHVASQDQVPDIFTKSLPKVLFDKYKEMIGMTDRREHLSLWGSFVGNKRK